LRFPQTDRLSVRGGTSASGGFRRSMAGEIPDLQESTCGASWRAASRGSGGWAAAARGVASWAAELSVDHACLIAFRDSVATLLRLVSNQICDADQVRRWRVGSAGGMACPVKLCQLLPLCLLAAALTAPPGRASTSSVRTETNVASAPAASPEAAAAVTIRPLDTGKYQLEVVNTSGIGFIDTFYWAPPPGVTITAITSSEGGRCKLLSGEISCTTRLAPPPCTCEAGGSMTVNFTATGLASTYANGYWTSYGVVGGYLQIQTMTSVPYHIPSYITPGL